MGELAPGDVRRAAHSAAFYGSPAGFIACVRAFADEGLDAAESVLVPRRARRSVSCVSISTAMAGG
jgi:hypothetical protein